MELNVVVTEPAGDENRIPIVFVHGAWHAAWCWEEHFTDHFASHGFRSYAIDLRGHGESGGSVRSARIAQYVHDVRRLVMELPIEPVLVGHSMGGFVVQHYLSRYRARAGVLMASVPTSGALGATLRVASQHPGAFARANAMLSLGPIVEDPATATALLFGPLVSAAEARKHTARLGNESYPAYLEMIADLPRASRVEDPMLVLGAQYDRLFSPSEVRTTAQAYGTDAILFGGMGHDMMLEPGWEQVARIVLDWIDEL